MEHLVLMMSFGTLMRSRDPRLDPALGQFLSFLFHDFRLPLHLLSAAAHMEEPQRTDLTYITERIITVLCPSNCPEQIYLHDLEQILVMLQSKHKHNCMVKETTHRPKINASCQNNPRSKAHFISSKIRFSTTERHLTNGQRRNEGLKVTALIRSLPC